MQTRSETDSLHQQASSHYLQGKFQEALDVWQKLLEIEPDDQRAQEGVRLCELLVAEANGLEDSDPDLVAEPVAPPPVASEPEDAPSAGDSFEFSDELDRLDEILGGSPEPAPIQPETSAADSSAVGIDPSESFLMSPSDEPPVAADPAEWGTPAETAAAELERRVGQLLEEAREAHQEGRSEDATGILNRLFILDESHDEAMALASLIQSEVGGTVDVGDGLSLGDAGQVADDEILSHGTLDLDLGPEDAPDLAPLDLGIPLAVPDVPPIPAAEAAPPPLPEETAEADAEAMAEEDLETVESTDEEQELEANASRAVVVPTAPVAHRSLLARLPSGPMLWVTLAVVAIAVVGGGTLLLGKMLGSDDAPPVEAATTPPAGTGANPANPTNPEAPPIELPENQAAPGTPDGMDQMLARAREAMADDDFEAAVLAFDEAVKLDPENKEAVAGFRLAVERYQLVRELEQEKNAAFHAFEAGDYREAMIAFYRMEDLDPGVLARYKRNGWYNMGLQAVRGGECKQAREQFTEALDIHPEDPGSIAGLELARQCRWAFGQASFREETDKLAIRSLDD